MEIHLLDWIVYFVGLAIVMHNKEDIEGVVNFIVYTLIYIGIFSFFDWSDLYTLFCKFEFSL